LEKAQAGTLRKISNLSHQKTTTATLNFGGQSNELWCDGGELKFVKQMILQSKNYAHSCFWFTSLVSKQSNLNTIYSFLDQIDPYEIKTIPMSQGNKISRIIAWTFLTPNEQKIWNDTRQRA
jgi:23S rRNA (adenine1618-N6)-methyltransferase